MFWFCLIFDSLLSWLPLAQFVIITWTKGIGTAEALDIFAEVKTSIATILVDFSSFASNFQLSCAFENCHVDPKHYIFVFLAPSFLCLAFFGFVIVLSDFLLRMMLLLRLSAYFQSQTFTQIPQMQCSMLALLCKL